MQNNRKLLASLLVTAGLTTSVVNAGGTGTTDGDSASYSLHNSVRTSYFLPPAGANQNDSTSGNDYKSRFNQIDKGEKKGKGLLGENIQVSGVTRFVTIQRTMSESYSDMTTTDRNISFTDYPTANANSGVNAGFPLLELNLQSKIKQNFNFNVGYSLGHNFTGNVDGNSRNIGAVQNLNFGAQLKTGNFKTSVWAGEVLWTNLSRFTMGQPEFRDNYFERLPWDWYRTSFTRYQEYFTLGGNIGAQNLGRAPLQGGIGVIEYTPLSLSFKAVYGQTNRSIIAADQGTGYPSIIQGYRLEKYIFERAIRGKVGANVYAKRAKIANNSDLVDNNTMYTMDFAVKVKKINFSGEIGGSQLNITDPNNDFAELSGADGRGFGASFKAEFDRRAVLWPFSIEFYNLTNNFGNVDAGVLNQNAFVKQGGAKNEFIYNDSYFVNIANEAGQVTNNRRGINLDFEANFGEFKAQFRYSASQEIEKLSDSLTIQHRVNSFSRSRFRPWFQSAGPYGRIKSFWFRTFETMTLNNQDGYLQRDLLGFNAFELALKYKKPIGKKHELVLLNVSTINTIKEGFNVFSLPGGDDVLTSVLYNDFTAAFKINRKLSVVANYAIEVTKGSERTAVEHTDPITKEKLVDYIDQLGTMVALGFDYDVSRKTSLHLRTKYMQHEDRNFTLDKFRGFETTFELKIFL